VNSPCAVKSLAMVRGKDDTKKRQLPEAIHHFWVTSLGWIIFLTKSNGKGHSVDV